MTGHTFAAFVAVTSLAAASSGSCANDGTQNQAPKETAQKPADTRARTAPGAEENQNQKLRASCPMLVEGTGVDVSDTEDGVALTFTGGKGNGSGDLQTRVDGMAEMYEAHRGHQDMMWHSVGEGSPAHHHDGDEGHVHAEDEHMHDGDGHMHAGDDHHAHDDGDHALDDEAHAHDDEAHAHDDGDHAHDDEAHPHDDGDHVHDDGVHAHDGDGHHTHNDGHMHDLGPMPAADVEVTEVADGVRLELQPADESELGALREHVHAHGELLHAGECWLPQG